MQVVLSVSNGTLSLATINGLTFSGGANGTSGMTFTGTLANINAALNSLTYTPINGYAGNDALTVNTSDLGSTGGGTLTASSTIAITVNHLDLAPVNAVPGAQSTNENAALVFSSATGNAITVSDSDSGGNSEQVMLGVSNGTLSLATNNGLTFSVGGTGTPTPSMTFTGTLANINAALAVLTFNPTTNFSGNVTLTVSTNDLGNTGVGGPLTATSTVGITVLQVNRAPVNSLPDTQIMDPNTTLVFSAATGNAITVSDSDSDGNPEQVTLSVVHGALSLAQTSGLTFTQGNGLGNISMTFTGTLANLNAALNGLTYSPNNGYGGGDLLTATTNDLGNTGVGGPLTTTSTVGITVNVIDSPPSQTTISTSTPAVTNQTSAAFTFTAVDATNPNDRISFQYRLDNGAWLSSPANLTLNVLAEGQHVLNVRAVNEVGSVDPSPATFTWTVDTTAPFVNFSNGPEGLTNSTSVAFTFQVVDTASGGVASGAASVEYWLDNAATHTIDTNPSDFNALSFSAVVTEGVHVFHVKATDNAGNTVQDNYSWVVDATAPTVTFISNPANPTSSTTAAFTFQVVDPTVGGAATGAASVEYWLDNAATHTIDTNPSDFNALSFSAAVTEGAHVFHVKAADNIGNVSETDYSWVVGLPHADLAFALVSGPTGTVGVDSDQTFTYSITNNGPAAVQEVQYAIPMPANIFFDSASQISGPELTILPVDVPGEQDLLQSVGGVIDNLASGQQVVFQVVLHIGGETDGATLTFGPTFVQALDGSIDPNPANNAVSTTVTALYPAPIWRSRWCPGRRGRWGWIRTRRSPTRSRTTGRPPYRKCSTPSPCPRTSSSIPPPRSPGRR